MAATIEPRSIVSDAALIERLAQRDSSALIELERRHRGSLYAQVYSILMDSTLAERVVCDAFTQIWFGAARLTGRRSAWSWLRDIAAELARAERLRR
jgi:DNA-directed RNA polymerase specialized sigma24 family protein